MILFFIMLHIHSSDWGDSNKFKQRQGGKNIMRMSYIGKGSCMQLVL